MQSFEFWTVLLFSVSVCSHLFFYFVLHQHGHVSYPLALNSHDRFYDFTIFYDKFRLFHTAKFWSTGFPMNYPAPVAVVFEIFFKFFAPHALFWFVTFSVLCFVVPAAWFARALAARSIAPLVAWRFAAVLCLLSWPVLLIVDGGNAEVIVWVALALGMWAYATGRLWTAAILIGIAASVKLFPFVFLALFLSRGRIKYLLTGAAFFLLVSLVTLKIVGPTIAIAYHGINFGLQSFKVIYMAQWHTPENGVDHSLFALIKFILVVGFHHPPLAFAHLLSLYLPATAIGGVLLYFLYICRLPLLNQVLLFSVVAIYLTAFSGDGTLIHLYYPLAMLFLLSIQAWRDGITIPGLRLVLGCLVFSVSMESFLVVPHLAEGARFIGQAHAVSLGILLYAALRYPLGPPLADGLGETVLSQPVTAWAAEAAAAWNRRQQTKAEAKASAGIIAKESAPVSRLGLADAACLAALTIILLTLSYLRSRHRMFWSDEIMGVLVLRQPGWHALLHAWYAGLDSSGLWFYVFAKPWLAIFGCSEVSLREFSATGIAASAIVLWITARRFYSLVPVAASIFFVYAAMMSLRWQLVNGRTYGVLMLASSLVLYLIVRGDQDDQRRPTPLFLLATLGAYALLAGSHILGILYVGMFLAIQLTLDSMRRRPRLLLYLSALLPALAVVLFSLPNLRSTAALGKPTYWTLRPTLAQLLTSSQVFGGRRLGLVIALLLILLLLASRLRARPAATRNPVYVVLLGFAAFDLFFFVYSQIATPLYVDRYLVPFALAAVLLISELLAQLQAWLPTAGRVALVPAVLVGLIGLFEFAHTSGSPGLPLPNYTDAMLRQMPPGIPIVDSDVGSYVETEFYHSGDLQVPFEVPIDWPLSLTPEFHGGVSGLHEMDNFKAAGWYAAGILPSTTILSQNKDFIVVSFPDNLWLHRRILEDPRFQAVRIGSVPNVAPSQNAGELKSLDIYRVTYETAP